MQEFLIAPADGRAIWLMAIVPVLVMLLVGSLFGAAVLGSRKTRFEVSREGLRIRGDFYGRTIPAAEIAAAGMAHVDLSRRPALAPGRRTMGTGLPGYRAGWFRLKNGEKALVYLTDTSRAVYVPTTAGFSLLLSPSDPDAFVTALRAATGR